MGGIRWRGHWTTTFEGLADDLLAMVGRYAHHFRSKTRRVTGQAEHYLAGLMQADRKNMERMAELVADSDGQRLHHFLSNSPWDHRAVMDQVAQDTDRLLGGQPDSCLIFDETSFAKKGRESVGVARQWCGRLGKLENCQVAVFAALSDGRHTGLIDARLFLPEEWVKDPKRCRGEGVPADQIAAVSKTQHALAMVAHARRLGVRFGWVGGDAGYGKEPAFLRGLATMGEIFVVDVHKNQHIYPSDPAPRVPKPSSGRGRKPSRPQAQSASLRVDQWVAQQPAEAWQRLTLRDSSRGKLRVDVLHQRVWLWDHEEVQAHCWHLVVRREVGAPAKIKYSLSNAPSDTPVARLAAMQGHRFWVERAFQDGKSECGLADYQVRGWLGWHHHVAMVKIAMLFMLEQRLARRTSHPLLSCADITEILKELLPRKTVNYDELLRQIECRHRRRQSAIDSAYRRQNTASVGLPRNAARR